MTQTKDQHFIPQSFLKGFTIEGEKSLIWEYDKKYSQISKIPRSIRKICYKEYYYEQITPDGEKTQTLEKGFEKVERASINIIRKLYKQKTVITGHEKGTLAYYIALLLTRGPSFRDGCDQFHKAAVEIKTQEAYESGKFSDPPEVLKESIKNNNIMSVLPVEVRPQVSLPPMLNRAEQIGLSLCNKRWDICFSKQLFATSDTPVIFFPCGNTKNIDPADPASFIYCPLNKHMLLTVSPSINSLENYCYFKDIHDKATDWFNQLTCLAAQRYVYFPEKSDDFLEYIRTTKDYSQKLRTHKIGNALWQTWDIDKNNQP